MKEQKKVSLTEAFLAIGRAYPQSIWKAKRGEAPVLDLHGEADEVSEIFKFDYQDAFVFKMISNDNVANYEIEYFQDGKKHTMNISAPGGAEISIDGLRLIGTKPAAEFRPTHKPNSDTVPPPPYPMCAKTAHVANVSEPKGGIKTEIINHNRPGNLEKRLKNDRKEISAVYRFVEYAAKKYNASGCNDAGHFIENILDDLRDAGRDARNLYKFEVSRRKQLHEKSKKNDSYIISNPKKGKDIVFPNKAIISPEPEHLLKNQLDISKKREAYVERSKLRDVLATRLNKIKEEIKNAPEPKYPKGTPDTAIPSIDYIGKYQHIHFANHLPEHQKEKYITGYFPKSPITDYPKTGTPVKYYPKHTDTNFLSGKIYDAIVINDYDEKMYVKGIVNIKILYDWGEVRRNGCATGNEVVIPGVPHVSRVGRKPEGNFWDFS